MVFFSEFLPLAKKKREILLKNQNLIKEKTSVLISNKSCDSFTEFYSQIALEIQSKINLSLEELPKYTEKNDLVFTFYYFSHKKKVDLIVLSGDNAVIDLNNLLICQILCLQDTKSYALLKNLVKKYSPDLLETFEKTSQSFNHEKTLHLHQHNPANLWTQSKKEIPSCIESFQSVPRISEMSFIKIFFE